ncbi:U1 small nuclear ribonucleoprotein C-like [Peromyscus leucopus]|uniref:U1 small nuclear ribonucleoprotein C-like n=1 Tax=Peromyscus leucopus TaxID=10041 RepID=UPI0018859A44|nr:U1 small nuclear ribonucleoprotein C-like [Peromyscus leucopus]
MSSIPPPPPERGQWQRATQPVSWGQAAKSSRGVSMSGEPTLGDWGGEQESHKALSVIPRALPERCHPRIPNPIPKFYCNYFDMYLTHVSPSVRKTHCSGQKHKENVKDYYQKWMEEQAQSLIDKTMVAFHQVKIPPAPFSAPPPAGAMIPPPPSLPGPPGPGMMPGPPMMRPPARPMMVPTQPGMTRPDREEQKGSLSVLYVLFCFTRRSPC